LHLFGDFDTVPGVIEARIARSPYLLSNTISAADVL
jgi:hypothetical protein